MEDGDPASNRVVCLALNDLIRAMSASTFAIRSPSFTEQGLVALRRAKKELVQVGVASRRQTVSFLSILVTCGCDFTSLADDSPCQ